MAVYYNSRINNFGVVFIGLHTLIILLVLYNRSLSQGSSFLFFLYISWLPVGINLFVELKNLKGKKNSFFQELAIKIIRYLDISFFNFLFVNKGVFYLSRLSFAKLDRFLAPYQTKPLNLLNKVVIIPWLIFMVTLVLEFYFSKNAYFSAILLSFTVILNRLFLFSLRILEYSSIDGLKYINAKYFFLYTHSIPYPLAVYFQRIGTIERFLNVNENKEANERRLTFLNSGRNFSSAYFLSKILKNYLYPKTKVFLNQITFLVILLLIVLKYQSSMVFLSDLLFLDLFAIFYLILKFDFNFFNYLEIINHQKRLLALISTKMKNPTLVFYPKNPKPKDVLDFFIDDIIWEVSNQRKPLFSFAWLFWILSWSKSNFLLVFFIWLAIFYFSNIAFLIFNDNFSFFSWSFLLRIYGIFDTLLNFVFLPPILQKIITFFFKS